MTIDRELKQKLIEARERIKAQIADAEMAANDPLSVGGPADFRSVYGKLKEELRQINELLGIDEPDDGLYRNYYRQLSTHCVHKQPTSGND